MPPLQSCKEHKKEFSIKKERKIIKTIEKTGTEDGGPPPQDVKKCQIILAFFLLYINTEKSETDISESIILITERDKRRIT